MFANCAVWPEFRDSLSDRLLLTLLSGINWKTSCLYGVRVFDLLGTIQKVSFLLITATNCTLVSKAKTILMVLL